MAKRAPLVDRVGDARESQQEAKEQSASALEKFISVTKIDGGNLRAKYGQLSSDFKRSGARATEVRERIVDASDALFSE